MPHLLTSVLTLLLPNTHHFPAHTHTAFAGHTLLSNWAPWNQGKYDGLLAKQLAAAGVSQADAKKAADVAVPIAVKLVKDRCVCV